jgi:hypothetical protein
VPQISVVVSVVVSAAVGPALTDLAILADTPSGRPTSSRRWAASVAGRSA